MKFNSIDSIKPVKDNCFVTVKGMQQESETGVITQVDEMGTEEGYNTIMYFGDILKIGSKSTANDVGLEVGQTAIFNRFAGSHIVNDKGFAKIINMNDIMAITEDSNKITVTNTKPAGPRLLLEVYNTDVTEDGLYIPKDQDLDPNLAAITYGKIISEGKGCKMGYSEGQLVGFEPHAGECIKDSPSEGVSELRVIREEDVILVSE